MSKTTRSKAFVRWMYANPWAILSVVGVITLVAAVSAARVQQDQSIEIWFLEDDPDLIVYQDFTDQFSADEIIVVGVFADDVFDLPTWEAIDELALAAESLPFVHRVVTANNLGLLNPYPEEDEPSLREQALANSIVSGTFVSRAGDAAAVVLQLTREANTFANKRLVVEALREVLTQESRLNTRIAGTPVTDDAAMRHNEHDMMLIVPLMVLVIACVAYFAFRAVLPVLLTVGVVLVAAAWAFGLMGLLAYDFTLVSTTLLPLILAVGVADSIHILAQYYRYRIASSHSEAATTAVTRLLRPCFFTSATTAAGLLALLVSDLAPIREFGLIAAFGVMSAFVASVLTITAVLGLREWGTPAVATGHAVLRASLQKLCVTSQRTTTAILVSAALMVAVFATLASQASVGIDPVAWYEDDDPVLVDTLAIDQAFGGSLAVEFLVNTEPQGLQRAENLERLDAFERWLERDTAVSRVLSLVDILKEIGRAGQLEADAEPMLPNASALNDIFAGMSDQFTEQWTDSGYQTGRLWARIPLSQSADAINQMPQIEAQIAERFGGDDLAVNVTGYAKLMVKMQEYILRGQIESLALAFVTVALLIGLLLRSLRLASVAMLTNLVPVAIGLGMMPLLGVSLNPGTVMVGAIVLGIVVDDTVHFLSAYRRHDDGIDLTQSLRETISEVGVPVVVTSVVLAAGFAALYLGDFVPSRDVGLITAIVVLMALLSDLALLPAVLRKFPASTKAGVAR